MIFFHLKYDNPRENSLPIEIQPFPGYNNMHPRWESNPQPFGLEVQRASPLRHAGICAAA